MTNIHTNTNTQNEISISPTTEVYPNYCPARLYGVRCLSPKNVERGELIGSGSHGRIFKGVLNNTTTVAIKKVSLEIGRKDMKKREEVKNEIKLLARLRESNMVIPIIGYYYTDSNSVLWIVMEYAENGNLMNFARQNMHRDCESIA
ncbi:kinase-like domain-containing protein [Jimgerdemannia flammicorona]|uniref:non-specific serine/threonine protein kinase n=1 Tax=Jimgerdemannia flammicorona TaxID=994334 RepID=A0A433DAR9_9FUNG|nr:kinase-like domain-containing protein [Jimgerdemannia flammicorona]